MQSQFVQNMLDEVTNPEDKLKLGKLFFTRFLNDYTRLYPIITTPAYEKCLKGMNEDTLKESGNDPATCLELVVNLLTEQGYPIRNWDFKRQERARKAHH